MKQPDLDADVLVAGGGPAGVALAMRLRRLGYDVALAAAPASGAHAFEMVNPAAQKQLAFEGLFPVTEATVEFEIRWRAGAFERRAGPWANLLVDRRAFHDELRRRAAVAGVRLLEGRVHAPMSAVDGWRLRTGAGEARARLLVDATGRRGMTPEARRRGAPLIGLHAAWTGERLPRAVRVAAAPEGWVWGAPTPDGGYTTSVFQDARFAGARGNPVAQIRKIVAEAGILEGAANARLAGDVAASDATPHVAPAQERLSLFRVGDAALGLDPLSSSGIQAALQSGIDAALAIHTLSKDPRAGAMVETFLERRLERRSARHAAWAGTFYREAAERFATPFWSARSGAAPATAPAISAPPAPDQPIALGPGVRIQVEPCPVDDCIAWRRVVAPPGTTEPIALVDGVEIAPLLAVLASGATPLQLLRRWSATIGEDRALRLFGWAWRAGLLGPIRSQTQSAAIDPSYCSTVSRSETGNVRPINAQHGGQHADQHPATHRSARAN
jgi:flavin-dependent dehydrogenase